MQRNVNTWSIQVMGIWVFIVYSVTLTVFFILNFFQNKESSEEELFQGNF